MNLLTTTQAADALQVSPRRIIAMINAGILSGQKLGRDWFVTAESVMARVKNNPGPGKPRKAK